MKTFALLAVTGTVAAYSKADLEGYESGAYKSNIVEISADPLTLISAKIAPSPRADKNLALTFTTVLKRNTWLAQGFAATGTMKSDFVLIRADGNGNVEVVDYKGNEDKKPTGSANDDQASIWW